MALRVVKPAASSVHDLGRVMATIDHFSVPSLVVINKADLNPTRSDEIASFRVARGVEMVDHILYDTVVTEAMVHSHDGIH